MTDQSNIVRKPWGYEYIAYENENVGLWILNINYGQSTSMHCHPKKTTGLVLLKGEAEVSFLADSRLLKAIDKIMIRRGLFHRTKALSKDGVCIIEIETPKEKEDLVRLNDPYGRASKPYEDSSFQEPRKNECLWISEPLNNSPLFYNLEKCNLKVECINDINIINNKNDEELIIFLKGGMVRTINGIMHCVTIPGDVGFAKIVKQVSSQLDSVMPQTIIMTITKNT
jgi:mannose-6-phosphate isomerase-like protein (cupin superfamily)